MWVYCYDLCVTMAHFRRRSTNTSTYISYPTSSFLQITLSSGSRRRPVLFFIFVTIWIAVSCRPRENGADPITLGHKPNKSQWEQ